MFLTIDNLKNKKYIFNILVISFIAILNTGCAPPAEKFNIIAPSGGLSTKSDIQGLNFKSFKIILKRISEYIPAGKKTGVVKSGINDIYDDMVYGFLKNKGHKVKKGRFEDLKSKDVDYYLLSYSLAKGTVGVGFPSKSTYTNLNYAFLLIDAKTMKVIWNRDMKNQEIKEFDLDKFGGVFGL